MVILQEHPSEKVRLKTLITNIARVTVYNQNFKLA